MWEALSPIHLLFLTSALLGVVPLSYWLWAQLLGTKAMERKLRESGFEPRGEGFVRRRGGVELHARLSGTRGNLMLTLQGPELPADTPRFLPAGENVWDGPSTSSIPSGDPSFDDAVRTSHADVQDGLSWLQTEVRSAVQEAVPLPARIMEGRWCYRQMCRPSTDVEHIASCIERASAAMAGAAPSLVARLEALAGNDDHPNVRARAIEALAARGALEPKLVSTLLSAPHEEMHLALVRAGGAGVVDAWRALHQKGGRRHRIRGARALASHLLDQRVEVDVDTMATLVQDLMNGLEDERSSTASASLLERLERPDLLAELDERFGTDAPTAVQALRGRLRDQHRAKARGAVSLAAAVGGNVSVAKE